MKNEIAPEPGGETLKIAIIYSDAKREYFPTQQAYITEVEVKQRAADIVQYLQQMNIIATTVPGDDHLHENLKEFNPNFVINLVDSVYGQEYLCASIPGTLELLHIPYTGSGMIGQSINSNKFLTKNLLEQWGLTIPKYQLIKDKTDEVDYNLDFPLITKLNESHGSIEMDESAIVENEKQLKDRVAYLIDTYHQPVVLEEYIAGREISVIVLEGLNTKVYAAEKIIDPKFIDKHNIASFNIVWNDGDEYEHSISYEKYELPDRVKSQLKTAFDVLKMEDYAKFDLRVDLSGRHYIIDANTNPALGPKFCSISTILALYGIDFREILSRIIKNALNGQAKNFQLPFV